MTWGRDKIGKTVEEIADHLRLVDHVKALQEGQKELAAAIRVVNDRLTAMDAEFKILKAETQRDALREVQQAVNSVQGAFHDKLNNIATRVAIIEHDRRADGRLPGSATLSLSDGKDTDGPRIAD
jgi:hypothetical protein